MGVKYKKSIKKRLQGPAILYLPAHTHPESSSFFVPLFDRGRERKSIHPSACPCTAKPTGNLNRKELTNTIREGGKASLEATNHTDQAFPPTPRLQVRDTSCRQAPSPSPPLSQNHLEPGVHSCKLSKVSSPGSSLAARPTEKQLGGASHARLEMWMATGLVARKGRQLLDLQRHRAEACTRAYVTTQKNYGVSKRPIHECK